MASDAQQSGHMPLASPEAMMAERGADPTHSDDDSGTEGWSDISDGECQALEVALSDVEWEVAMEKWQQERLDAAREAAVCAAGWQDKQFITETAAQHIKEQVHTLISKQKEKMVATMAETFCCPTDKVCCTCDINATPFSQVANLADSYLSFFGDVAGRVHGRSMADAVTKPLTPCKPRVLTPPYINDKGETVYGVVQDMLVSCRFIRCLC